MNFPRHDGNQIKKLLYPNTKKPMIKNIITKNMKQLKQIQEINRLRKLRQDNNNTECNLII